MRLAKLEMLESGHYYGQQPGFQGVLSRPKTSKVAAQTSRARWRIGISRILAEA